MTIDDDTSVSSSSTSSSSTTYKRKQTNPQQSSPIAHIPNIRSSFQSNTSSTSSINKPVSIDYIQSIRANFQSLDDIILQTYTSKDSSSTSGAVQSPSDNVKSVSELASVSSSQLAAIGSVNGANNNGKDEDDKDFVDIGNIQNNNNNNTNEEVVQQLRGGTVDEKAAAAAAAVVTNAVNNNDNNINNRPSIDNSEISGATSISDYMPVSTSLPSSDGYKSEVRRPGLSLPPTLVVFDELNVISDVFCK